MPTTVFSELDAKTGVRLLTLNRPERLNAINDALIEDFNGALDEALADDATRAIVLTGAGRAFCAGDDLRDFENQAGPVEQVRAMTEGLQDITRKLVLGDKMVIGAIHGWAVGGGLEWVINCDFPILGESARMFFPEINLGLFVTGAVTTMLPRIVGLNKARELMLFGEKFDAQAALEMGLAWKVVPDDALLDEARATAERIAALPAMQTSDMKKVLTRASIEDIESAIDRETDACVRSFLDPETAKRIAAFGS